jgi:uncharacterized membrane protein
MEIVIYFFAAGFLFMSAALMFAYKRSRQYGLFLIGLCYGVGGIIAIIAADWWPLAAAFALGWVLRMVGLDPDPAREQKQESPPQS